ncbi:hypothetical protein D0962_34805 [Leptolyngbyaceae cyanobacterium CCMR0082]|uniref:Trypsin-co-occurring domain-containing protein n=1 Tax=Adonisia turfae CCMR0082 TaxID=2304604 RepID=A0A6M0SHQ2_9CYAN|nr:CU044_2847 family protein [Adonisia turfae]NEZ67866.1 hypothetical protein [Adonisia turfae CCMR0082]
MKKLIKFTLADNQEIIAEVDEPIEDGRVGLRPSEMMEDAKQTFEQALENVRPMATVILSKLQELKQPANEVEVKFGVKLTAEAGAIIAMAGGEVNYEITLKWTNN